MTPYALSVHHFITTVGADAGFAAIIGLALLVLLFFIHARETANLRARTTEAEDALHRLEAYVDQIGRAGVAPSPAPAPAAAPRTTAAPVTAPPVAAPAMAAAQSGAGRSIAPAPAPVGMMTRSPAAPAGVGAPALSAATRLIPAADDGAISIRSNRSSTVVDRVRAATAVAEPPAPAPSTTAGGANGTDVPRVPPPPSAGQTSPGQTSAGRERLPLRPPGRSAPIATSGSRRHRGQRSGGRVGRGAIVLAAALVIVIAVGAVLVLTNNSGSSSANKKASRGTAGTTTASATHARSARAASTVTPAAVTVAVLNGTSTTNLAHDISSKLKAAGYRQGAIATATDQTESSTIVGYLPNDKRDALAVAKSLKLGPASVQAVDQNNRTVACNGSTTSCPAQVVVTVGSDLATNA